MLDLKGYGWMLWDGVQVTLAVAFCAMALALALGLVGTTGKLAHNKVARTAADTYTTVVRGVPELLLILIVYYGAPTLIQDTAEKFGYDILIDINPFIAGSITIGFIYGAFATEVDLVEGVNTMVVEVVDALGRSERVELPSVSSGAKAIFLTGD